MTDVSTSVIILIEHAGRSLPDVRNGGALRVGSEFALSSAMASVHQLITAKARVVHTISQDAPVLEAVAKMVAEDIGSLVVLRDGDPCGMLTERDFLTRVVLEDRAARSMRVSDIMSPDVIFVRPETDVGVCMALMTRLRLRHLPVLENTHLVGLISSGDIIKHLARESEYAADELTHYIRGR